MNSIKYYFNLASIVLSLSLISMVAYAANPASKEYVDQKAANLQTQINAIKTNNLQIGQYYQGGVIFYLDNAQRKGLLVAIRDADYTLSSGCTTTPGNGPYGDCFWWNGTGTQTTGAQDAHYFKGEQNTQTILAINPGSTVYPAAYVAHQYSTPQDPPGTYWYLPSQDELNELMLSVNNVPLINTTITAHAGQILPLLGSPTGIYWSSTEYAPDTLIAWAVAFTVGNVGLGLKGGAQLGVRPVRAFSY